MSVHNNPDSITQKMYTALTNAHDAKNSVKVSVGSFRGARVKLVLNGETYKMSFKELQTKVRNLNTDELTADQLGILKSRMQQLTTAAGVTPKGKALLGKVKDAFKSFKDKIGEAKEKLGEVKEKIGEAPGKIRDAKNELVVQHHLRQFALSHATIAGLSPPEGPSIASLHRLADELLNSNNLNSGELEKLKMILTRYSYEPSIKDRLASVNQKLAL